MLPVLDVITLPPVGHPHPVAAGTYTSIDDVQVPASARAGDIVYITVLIKNLLNDYNDITCMGMVNGEILDFGNIYYHAVPWGDNLRFEDSFVMPVKSAKLEIWSYYRIATGWYSDDYKMVTISLVGGWAKLATKTITITPEIVVPPPVWIKLVTKTITITPEIAPVGWVKLANKTITLTPEGYVPPPPPPEEVKKFPWEWVLIGGGGLIAVVGIASAKRK